MITSKKIHPKTLILRFKKQNKNLIKSLDENNIGFILLPLMSIKALESEKIIKSINNISSTDIFIFVSQNAVETSYKYLSFNNSKIVAIGPTTKSKIEKSGAKVNFCPKDNFTSENLLNSDFLKTIYLYLKKDGKIFIATDSKSYSHSILNIIYSMQDIFLWKNQRKFDWDYANLNVPKTKFFKKRLFEAAKI